MRTHIIGEETILYSNNIGERRICEDFSIRIGIRRTKIEVGYDIK